MPYGEGDPERWWCQEWIDAEDNGPTDMDVEMDLWAVMDWWALRHNSNAKAYHYLEGLDLGQQLKNARAVGNRILPVAHVLGMTIRALRRGMM